MVQVVTGDSQEEVLIFRDRQIELHHIVYIIIIKVHLSGYSVLGNYAPLEKKRKRNENCRQGERLISAGHLLARRDGRLRVGESGELVSIIMFIKIFKIMIIMTIFMIKLMTTA